MARRKQKRKPTGKVLTEEEKTLRRLVYKLTHSGQKTLSQEYLSEIKNICKNSDGCVKLCCYYIIKNLHKQHSEVRLSAYQLSDYLFRKSHVFRETLLVKFRKFVDLTTGTCTTLVIPPPQKCAEKLKKDSIITIYEWNKKFGDEYPSLRIGYNYLKDVRQVDFEGYESRITNERLRRGEKEKREENVLKERVRQCVREMEEQQEEICSTLEQMENCFTLLIPKFDDGSSSKDDSAGDVLREHGITSRGFSITIDVDKGKSLISKDENNEAIIENLQDLKTILQNTHSPTVERWWIVLNKGKDSHLETAERLKNNIKIALTKYNDLGLEEKDRNIVSTDDSSSESEFEEVEDKEGFEDLAVSTPVPAKPALKQSPSSATKTTIARIESLSKKSTDSDENNSTPNKEARCCGVLLPSGVPCPRRDTFKCPFHGPIKSPSERLKEEQKVESVEPVPSTSSTVPDWQDPELLKQLEESTGINLKMPEPRGKGRVRGKKRKTEDGPRITSLKAIQDTARKRLQKKLFKRRKLL